MCVHLAIYLAHDIAAGVAPDSGGRKEIMTFIRHLRRSFLRGVVLLLLAVPAAAQSVYMVPHVALPTTSTFTVYFYLDADAQEVMGVEVSLEFDETIVQLDGIDAGDWFTTSGLDWFFWDYTTPGTDTIHFTGALLDEGRVANGVIAVCRFTAIGLGVCPVDFTDVDVRDASNQTYAAGHSTGDQIIIDAAIGNETMSFGDIKALYR